MRANARNAGSVPGSRRFPGEIKWQPTPVFLLENSTDRGAWWLESMELQKSWQDLATKQQQLA